MLEGLGGKLSLFLRKRTPKAMPVFTTQHCFVSGCLCRKCSDHLAPQGEELKAELMPGSRAEGEAPRRMASPSSDCAHVPLHV